MTLQSISSFLRNILTKKKSLAKISSDEDIQDRRKIHKKSMITKAILQVLQEIKFDIRTYVFDVNSY